MRIDIITAVPELLESPLNYSIVKRARDKGLVEINIINLHDFANDKYKSVDDYAFGGGAGMVMMIEPVYKALEKLKNEREYDEIIYTSPDGEIFNQKLANQLSLKNNIIILAGHYKGIDQRIRDHLITREISIGDYVLSGGELPAAAIVDAIVRLIPGALGDEQSALSDSFQDDLLAPPVYTRPADFNGWKVPEILLSGHAEKIENWRHEMSEARTKRLRPGLFEDEGEKGRKGEREKGRKGEGEKGRRGEGEKGRRGEKEKGRKGDEGTERRRDGETKGLRDRFLNNLRESVASKSSETF